MRLEACGWEGGTGHSPDDATTLGAAPDGGLFTEVPGRCVLGRWYPRFCIEPPGRFGNGLSTTSLEPRADRMMWR